MLNQKKAVIFDLDGTLVDSMWMWKSIDIEFLGVRGIVCPDDLEREIEGMSFTETAFYFKERFHLEESLDAIKGIWTDMSLDKYKNEVPLKPGAGEFLAYLASQGIHTGIATSNGREMVDAVIESLKIGKYFKIVATSCEVAAGKPAPDIYLKVAKELDVLPSQCLVFEDVPAGILAGKRAGMTVCAVDDEFSRALEDEKRELADYFIYDYYQLLKRNGVNS